MKITIECESIEELYKLARKVSFHKISPELIADEPEGYIEPAKEDPAPAAVKQEEAPKAKEEPKEEAAKEPEEPEEEPVSIVDARKLLSIANKKTKRNIASEWINEEGFKSLTEIKDQTVLKRLIAKAEEVTNAG